LKARRLWAEDEGDDGPGDKKCEVCNVNNRKKQEGCGFVTTTRRLEKIGADLAEIGEEGGMHRR
jgi:hypothetical protein